MIELDLQNPPPQGRAQGRLADAPETSFATPRPAGILIVDTDEMVCSVLSSWLRRQGFVVWRAPTTQEALDVYRNHRHDIDAVLLDVRTADLDGAQTLAALQRLNPQVRCCFMGGDLDAYAKARLRHLGATTFLRKPFHLTELLQALWVLARGPRSRRRVKRPRPNLNFDNTQGMYFG